MMILKEFLTSLLIALILSSAFALATRKRGRRSGFGWYFLFILMATWAGGVWIRPFGPTWWQISWLPFLVFGLIVTFLVTLVAPRRPPSGRYETLEKLEQMAREKEFEKITYIALGVFFWVVFFILMMSIFTHYVRGV